MKIAILNDTHCGIRNPSEIFLNRLNLLKQEQSVVVPVSNIDIFSISRNAYLT